MITAQQINLNLPHQDLVISAIREHYDEFLECMPDSKLLFVKLLKKYTGLGLKDSKDNVDIIFNSFAIHNFKSIFGVKEQRKGKLEKLKIKLFAKELVEILKDKNDDELVECLSKLTLNSLEEILEKVV